MIFGSAFELGLFIVFCYILLYALVDRICKCCEQCAITKSFGHYLKNTAAKEKIDEIMKGNNK